MDDRLKHVEGRVDRLERTLERIADTLDAIQRDLAARSHQEHEIQRLRDTMHKHAQVLEHVPLIERRLDKLADAADALRAASARNSVIVSLVSGAIAAALALMVRGVLG